MLAMGEFDALVIPLTVLSLGILLLTSAYTVG